VREIRGISLTIGAGESPISGMAGKTWDLDGLEKTKSHPSYHFHPEDPNTVFVGAIGSLGRAKKTVECIRLPDGGKNLKKDYT